MAEIRFIEPVGPTPRARTQILPLAAPRASATALRDLAARIVPTAGRPSAGQDAVAFTYTDGPHAFALYRASGAFRYRHTQRWQMDDGKSAVTYDDAEAVKRATKIVSDLGLAPSKEFDVLKVARLHVGSSTVDGKNAEDRVIDAAVCFRRKIGSVSVEGPGGMVVVYLDHDGGLTGLDRIWRTVAGAPQAVTRLRNPRELEAEVTRQFSAHPAGRIEVRAVRFGYFELGPTASQRVLQPSYVLPLTFVSEDERLQMKSVHVVAAAENAVGTLSPPPKKAVEQPARKA